jgi:hypothetical protein
MAKDQYTALRVLVPDAEQFRRLARQLAAEADRDLTQSQVLAATVAYALKHVPDVAAQLAASGDDG